MVWFVKRRIETTTRGSRELAPSLVEGAARARPVLGGGVALDKRGRMGYIVSRT